MVSAWMIASVSGIVSRQVVPLPRVDSTSTEPPMRSMLVFTTSIPTPRPDTLVTFWAVEKPGWKTSIITSRGSSWVACSAVTMPRATAVWRTRSTSMPAPSSLTSTVTCPPSW
jgi:hypothetical protein